jgi:hypothetical protein
MGDFISMARTGSILVAAGMSMVLITTGAAPARPSSGFVAHVSRISDRLAHRMTGKSWHRGCPVPLRDLRVIRVSFHGFDGERHFGRVVANEDARDALLSALRSMWNSHFKIHRMRLVDHYDASDHRSMRADNTSAFNCRYVAGTSSWSEHAYGRAIDINPVENPYVGSDGSVSPKKGRPYTDRSRHAPGLIHSDGATVRAFADAGWGWGGNWSSPKDYQHFSASGR